MGSIFRSEAMRCVDLDASFSTRLGTLTIDRGTLSYSLVQVYIPSEIAQATVAGALDSLRLSMKERHPVSHTPSRPDYTPQSSERLV
jgi:hypothetical protein